MGTFEKKRTASACRARRRIAALGMLAWFAIGAARAATLPVDALARVQAATFEVVVRKPTEDKLSYERPLPLELQSFQYRNDKYLSIGTAFAIGDHRYATASHVILATLGGQFGAPALRDASGKVYAIDQILKYSVDQDFAVFSLIDDPAPAPLEINPHPVLNQPVYAVGNALGTGVVIRDGLYTSDTPEDQDGRWQWMRFSAAASPGNSGGPLLDADGRLIGIVLMKSANENLNFALPIQRIIDAPDHLATADVRQSYQLNLFDRREISNFKLAMPLPKPYADFERSFIAARDSFSDQQLAALLSKNANELFPRAPGSNRVLHRIWSGATPGLIERGDDGEWSQYVPSKILRTDLGHNGYLSHGLLKSDLLVHLRKPDDLPAAQLYSDTQRLADLLLQGLVFKRTMGSEQIRLTSLGKAAEDSVYTDHYHRKWQVRTWPIAYNDNVLIAFALPVPDGYALLIRATTTRNTRESIADLRVMADYSLPAYDGTIAQWREYLKAAAPLLPDALTTVALSFGDKALHYRSKRIAFDCSSNLLPISDDSKLKLDFSYFNDRTSVVWDVAGVSVLQDAHSNNGIDILRNAQPSEDLDDSFQSHWNKIIHRQHPFDGVAFNDGDVMYIRAVQPLPEGTAIPDAVYVSRYQAEGTQSQETMKARLDLLTASLQVLEH
jgi:S1-C subfamily serine protease